MKPIQGQGTLTFDDGESFDVRVDIKFSKSRGVISGQGSIWSDDLLSIASKDGQPILECNGQRIMVIVAQARGDGSGHLKTSGGPL